MRPAHIRLVEDNEGDIVLAHDALDKHKVKASVSIARNGHEILSRIKHDEALQSGSVIMLTTSSNPKDIEHASANRATDYFQKPLDVDRFLSTIKKNDDLWLQLVAE
jgi:CheY-like chemotaxis protein